MATFYGRYGSSSQPVALFSAPPSVALGAPPSLALRAPPAVALRGLGATPTVALGSAPVVALGYFGAVNPDSYEGCLAEHGTSGKSFCDEAYPEDAKKAAKEGDSKPLTGEDWAKIFTSIGVATKPIMDAVGRLIDPNTGKEVKLSPEMAAAYKQFLSQQQNKLPSWVVPAAVVAGIAVIALVVMKK